MNRSRLTTLAVWVLLLGVFIVLLNSRSGSEPSVQRTTLLVLQQAVSSGDVSRYSYTHNGLFFQRKSDRAWYLVLTDWESDAASSALPLRLEQSGAVYSEFPDAGSGPAGPMGLPEPIWKH